MSFKKELNDKVIKVREDIICTGINTFTQTLKDRMNKVAKDGDNRGSVIFSDHTIYEKLYHLFLNLKISCNSINSF